MWGGQRALCGARELAGSARAQALEARVDWAAWALEQGVVSAAELEAPAAPALGGAQHFAAALGRLLDALLAHVHAAGEERAPPSARVDPALKRVALKALELSSKARLAALGRPPRGARWRWPTHAFAATESCSELVVMFDVNALQCYRRGGRAAIGCLTVPFTA